MDKGHKLIVFLLVLSLTAGGGLCTAFADDDGHREKRQCQKRQRNHSDDNGQRDLPIVSDPAYIENLWCVSFRISTGIIAIWFMGKNSGGAFGSFR